MIGTKLWMFSYWITPSLAHILLIPVEAIKWTLRSFCGLRLPISWIQKMDKLNLKIYTLRLGSYGLAACDCRKAPLGLAPVRATIRSCGKGHLLTYTSLAWHILVAFDFPLPAWIAGLVLSRFALPTQNLVDI